MAKAEAARLTKLEREWSVSFSLGWLVEQRLIMVPTTPGWMRKTRASNPTLF
jgi:hypothetical protein